MDFKKILSAPIHAGQAVVRDLVDNPEQADAKAQVLKMLADQGGSDVQKFTPPAQAKEWSLPELDASLSEEGQQRKAEAEANGDPFVPTEDDYKDSGPYGYLHKKSIHDALNEYEQELQANRPKIDYEGIMKSRMSDLANAPEAHRANPLFQFAMAMGNPEHAAELVKEHNQNVEDSNKEQQMRWQELLDMKKDALEGSIKQAMAEGDAKKVISGKWLETLAQIEQDKAKLAGTMQGIDEKNAGAARRAELRGQWALAAVNARADAMLKAAGIHEGSSDYRNLMTNARTMLNSLVKSGKSFEDAYDAVDNWMEDQVSNHPAPAAGGAAPTTAAPQAPAGASTNPMEQAILNARKNKKP